VPGLTPEQVQADMEYWRSYIARLKGDPAFVDDIDAQRSFSKLRNTGGNIYKWRNMAGPAEQAYRQALELWPGNTETLNNFSDLLLRQGRSAELRDILSKAVAADPNNGLLVILLKNAERKIQLQAEIAALQQQRAANPKDPALVQQLLGKYSEEGNIPAADQLIGEASAMFPTNAEILRDAVNYFALQNRVPQALEYGRKLEKVTPQDPEVKYGLAKFVMLTGNRAEFYKMLEDSVRLGGLPMRERIATEPMFQQIQGEPEFQKLVRPTQ
jgi:Tfp pilus assembly protein PilF